MSKDPRYIRLIQSKAWRNLRDRKLRDQPLCEHCQREGRLVPATEVHHAVPVETARTAEGMRMLMFTPGNLVSLCHDCHAAAHRRLNSHGKEEAARRRQQEAAAFARRYLE